MEVLFEETDRSPLVTLEGDELTIMGRSYMDNAVEFYRNLISRIDGMKFTKLDVAIKFEYFNTSSSKCLLELFHFFEKLGKDGKELRVFWYFSADTPDLEEAGEDYRDLIKQIPFELIEMEL